MKIWVLNPPFRPKFSRPQRSPAVTKSGTMYFPIWLAYCVGVLEAAGHEVAFTDAPARSLAHDDIFEMAGQIRPRLIVMDTSTPSIANDLRVAEGLKKRVPGAFITLVGTHVSALPEETLRASASVDAIARREYEHTVRELAAVLSQADAASQPKLAAVRGLSFRSNGNIIHNEDRPHIENLDELPWVSRVYQKHLRIADYFNANALYPMVTLISGRGCPFRCSFCVYPQTLTGRQYRFRSISDVVDEMEYVIREFPGAKSVFFEDDTLTANKKRCLELADAIIARGAKIPWEANARADLDLATMRKLRAAGCRELCVGFESGNQAALNGMRKGIEVGQMFQFMRDARTAGLLVHGCFMFGFPGETRASILETVALALRLKPDTAQFYPVMVYPGTEAYEEYRGKGWLTADSYAGWLTSEGLHNCVVCNEHLSSQELVRLCDHARRKFYLRPAYFVGKMLQVLKEPGEFRRTARAASVFVKYLVRGSRV